MGMGGGGGQNTSSTVQTVKIPDYLQDASLKAVQASQDLASQPYQAYPGQTIASLTGPQLAGLDQGVTNAGNPAYAGYATDAINRTQQVPGMVNPTFGAAAGTALSAPGTAAPLYDTAAGQAASIPGQVNPLYNLGASTVADASNPQGLVDNGAVMSQGDIAPWMSPYIAQALAPQLAAIQRQGTQTGLGINRGASAAGAFGDARTGIQAGMNDRSTMEAISGAVGTGYQSAYDRAVSAAQQVAGQRQALTGQRLTANQQQAAAGTSLAQIASQMGATGMNAADLLRQIASARESGDANAAQTAAQIAAQMGSSNLAAASQQGQLTAQDYALQQQQAQDLMGYGKTMQDQTQASLSQAYQDFVNQREAPKENLNLLLAAIQGVPYSTTRLTTTPYNATAANLGAITSLLGVGGKLASSATA